MAATGFRQAGEEAKVSIGTRCRPANANDAQRVVVPLAYVLDIYRVVLGWALDLPETMLVAVTTVVTLLAMAAVVAAIKIAR